MTSCTFPNKGVPLPSAAAKHALEERWPVSTWCTARPRETARSAMAPAPTAAAAAAAAAASVAAAVASADAAAAAVLSRRMRSKFSMVLPRFGAILWRLLLLTTVVVVATTLQGCLPPDWSFCDCDFRDNFWNHILNDVHMLWDGKDTVAKARNNKTILGEFLENPPGYDCPVHADTFWKAWPRFGLTRGLIEGSMGDLWMPAARDRIKGTCMAGHLAMVFVCSQHFLVKMARAMEAGSADYMQWLEAAYSHMIAFRNLGQAYQLRNCMGQQGWPHRLGGVHGYAVRWLGPEQKGTNPMAAYMGNQIDPYQMLYTEDLSHNERTHMDALPDRRPCAPFKNPQCWKRQSKLLMETCEHCCSPFIHKGGRGDPSCFDEEWTFEKCCNTDYKDLVCEMKRKGEEGGCVDCKKTVVYACLTPPEKRLQDAQNKYNADVDSYNNLQKNSGRLAKEIVDAQNDLTAKDGVYREKHNVMQHEFNVWAVAFNNESRLMSSARLAQQTQTWNNTALVLQAADKDLQLAREALVNTTRIRDSALSEEKWGRGVLKSNETVYTAAVARVEQQKQHLARSQAELARSSVDSVAADAEALRMIEAEDEASDAAEAANHILSVVVGDTALELDVALVAQRAAEHLEREAVAADSSAQKISAAAAEVSKTAQAAVENARRELVKAEESERKIEHAKNISLKGLEQIARVRLQRERELEDGQTMEQAAQSVLMDHTGNTSAVRCLLSHTLANSSARPSNQNATTSSQTKCSLPEDQNEFCATWATGGECEVNPGYMLRACAKSCAGKAGKAASLVPVCTEKPRTTALDNKLQDATPKTMNNLITELSTPDTYVLNVSGETSESEELDEFEAGHVSAISVPEEFQKEVNKTSAVLQIARNKVPPAERDVETKAALLKKAAAALEEADQKRQIAEFTRQEASTNVSHMERAVARAEALVRGNQSAQSEAEKTLKLRIEDVHRLRENAKQAATLEQGLTRAQKLAAEAAAQKQDAVTRGKRQTAILEDHIDTINSSISENITSVVSAWLQGQDGAIEDTSSSWSSRLVNAAKSALMSMVSSIEMFLEVYVVSFKDKQMILEMVRAVEDLKSARTQLRDAESAARTAESQATDAQASLAKATATKLNAQEAIQPAEARIVEAEENLKPIRASIELASLDLNATEGRLEAGRRVLQVHEAELNRTTLLAVAASDAANARALEHADAERIAEAAQAAVVQAAAALSAARVAHREAIASASRTFLTKLQRHCEATISEFEVWQESKELISFLRAVVAKRRREVVGSKVQHEQTAANHSFAEVALSTATKASDVARAAYNSRKKEAEAAAEKYHLVNKDAQETAGNRTKSSQALKTRREETGIILQKRAEPEAQAKRATEAHTKATVQKVEAQKRAWQKGKDLAQALNMSRTREKELLDAEQDEVRRREDVARCKMWLDMFNASLEIDKKERAVVQATELRERREDYRQQRLRRERQMHLLLETHKRHLDLCNEQVFLANKTAAKDKAKAEYEAAEQAVTAAKVKLDSLIEQNTKNDKSIVSTYQALQKGLEDHKKAEEEYAKQDPKDRERSFTTKLEGSGADPGGVDIR